MVTCPKCKAKGGSIVLREYWRNHGIEFDQHDDGSIGDENGDGTLFDGSAYEVRGWCLNCGREWKLRGVLQISELKHARA